MNGIGAAYGLLGAMLVGTGLGWGIDRFVHTSPFGLIAGIVVGFAAGLYGVYQALNKP